MNDVFDLMPDVLIMLHVATGGVALLAGALALIATKGSMYHKRSGMVFFISMMTSATVAMVIALLPGHYNPFLFSIGIFSSYFILGAYRALKFKDLGTSLRIDKIIAITMLITGLLMPVLPVLLLGKFNIVSGVFGIAGVIFAYRDLRLFAKEGAAGKAWLQIHLGKMTGGYIAAFTAFLVVNEFLPALVGWFAPSFFGGFYIAWWLRKTSVRKNFSQDQ